MGGGREVVSGSPQHRAWEAAETVPSGRRSLRRPTTLITHRHGYELSLENDIRACANRFGAETVGLERSSYVGRRYAHTSGGSIHARSAAGRGYVHTDGRSTHARIARGGDMPAQTG